MTGVPLRLSVCLSVRHVVIQFQHTQAYHHVVSTVR